MVQPNYLGTQSNLTGIPSLLLSSLQNVQDPIVQTALYQVQNWANSFYQWQFGRPTGTYSTGGVTVAFDNPYPSNVLAVTFGPIGGTAESQVSITTVSVVGFDAQLFVPGGTEVANGAGYSFFYMAFGH